MGKNPVFACEACGYESLKWMGRCPRCGGWDTIKEYALGPERESPREKPVLVTDEELPEERIVLGMAEMDRVLGGGLTTGSSILLGGDPGIGKTTLAFEIASKVVELGFPVLYVSGEESPRQLSSRRRRLNLRRDFPLLVTNSVEDILQAAENHPYKLVVVDSIQSVCTSRLPMQPGSVSQIRDASSRLIRELKRMETAHIFIGHVTKEGAIAGPKVLEHMVDTVLYFEGDKMLPYRMLRAVKNRYGPVDEVGIFQMRKEGLVSVENPSEFFVSERRDMGSGSTLFAHVTGSRPIILEVQAITPKTNFAMPKRLAVGYDVNRLFILIAVIEKVIGKPFFDRDIYVNVTGGMKVGEPAADLSVAASILSSLGDVSLGKQTVLFGEIGLAGEVRKVMHMDLRLKECERLGIKRVICPGGVEDIPTMEVLSVKTVGELYSRIKNIR
jgi:DNA repair protein RadA/Sms